ncbi:unnamed protein product [Adineta ricciae]|uniref:Short/branched chain specific acyl-CoA dehydrogenase, mitochondrial n=1 Tax=Adineta ricciae TaxID=249248 RepID=A0A815IKQ5_ADIRI|nr:unnamed protein product [Adineta ricciae]
MSQKVQCGRSVIKDGVLKTVNLSGGGGVRDCILSHIDMGFDEIHDKLRELYEIDPADRNSKLYDYKNQELDTSRYRTFFDYVHQNGLKFRNTLLYLCTPADERSLIYFSSPEKNRTPQQVTRRIPQVEADSSTSPEVVHMDTITSPDQKPTSESLLNNHIVQNLRISSTTSFSNYSFDHSINQFVIYVRDLIQQYRHENILIQLFEYLCTLQGLSSITLDRLKEQIQSIDEHKKLFYQDALEKIEKLLRSIRILVELNRMTISHIDQHATIIDSFNQFQQNFNILCDRWNNANRHTSIPPVVYTVPDPAPSRSVSSTHRPTTSARSYTNDIVESGHKSSSRTRSSDRTSSSTKHSTAPTTRNHSADRRSSRHHVKDRTPSSTNHSMSSTSRNHRTDRPSSRHHPEKQSRTLSTSPDHHHHHHHRHYPSRTSAEEEDQNKKLSLFRNLYKSLYYLSNVLRDRRFQSFDELIKRMVSEVSTCQSTLVLSDRQSLDQATSTIIDIEKRLSNRIQSERHRVAPHEIYRNLEESSDRTLDCIKQLLNDFDYYKSKANSSKRPRLTRWSSPDQPSTNTEEHLDIKPSIHSKEHQSRRKENDDYDDQSSEASRSSFGDEVLMEVAKTAPKSSIFRSRNLSTTPINQSLYNLSEEEQLIKETVARFGKEHVEPYIREMEEAGAFKPELMKAIFDQGWMGIEIPTQYGGGGSDIFGCILAIEEASKIDSAFGGFLDVQNTVVNPFFIQLANDEQKATYLPRLAKDLLMAVDVPVEYGGSGQTFFSSVLVIEEMSKIDPSVASFCLTEPTSGSDAFALKTTAEKRGDYYVLNGTKMWISNAEISGVYLVMANSNPTVKHKGISTFIVDRDTEGLRIGKREKKLGLKASSTCMIPAKNLLGKEGHGYKYAISMLNEGRIGIAAQMVGVSQGAFDKTIPYTKERKQFGHRIFDFQAMQHQIALLATEIEAARLLTYNAARLRDAKLPFVKQAAMAKYYASELAGRVTSKCIDFMGGLGFSCDYPQEKFFRDCKVGTIYEGTSNVQLNTIAKFIDSEY